MPAAAGPRREATRGGPDLNGPLTIIVFRCLQRSLLDGRGLVGGRLLWVGEACHCMKRNSMRNYLQPVVFGLGLLEERTLGVGFFPEGEEILIGTLGLGRISRQSQRPA